MKPAPTSLQALCEQRLGLGRLGLSDGEHTRVVQHRQLHLSPLQRGRDPCRPRGEDLGAEGSGLRNADWRNLNETRPSSVSLTEPLSITQHQHL